MTAKLVTLPPEATADDAYEAIERDGAVIIRDFVRKERLDGLIADVEPYIARAPFGEELFDGPRTQRVGALIAKSLHSEALIMQPLFQAVAHRWLCRPSRFLWEGEPEDVTPVLHVSVTEMIRIWPGQLAQGLHRDDLLWHRTHPGPDCLMSILTAGTRFTRENGATMVIPGSHRWDDQRVPRVEEAIPAEMERGSALIYLGSTYHGGGANHTASEQRTAIHAGLVLGYLTQEENQFLVVPQEMVRRYDEPMRRMIGWAICPPFCNYIERDDPIHYVDRDIPTVAESQTL